MVADVTDFYNSMLDLIPPLYVMTGAGVGRTDHPPSPSREVFLSTVQS